MLGEWASSGIFRSAGLLPAVVSRPVGLSVKPGFLWVDLLIWVCNGLKPGSMAGMGEQPEIQFPRG